MHPSEAQGAALRVVSQTGNEQRARKKAMTFLRASFAVLKSKR
jgi:hypothetical protein